MESNLSFADKKNFAVFAESMNEALKEATRQGNAPWMNNSRTPPVYCCEPFNGFVYRDSNQVLLQLANAQSKDPCINYAPTSYLAQKKEWFQGAYKNNIGLASVCCMGNADTGVRFLSVLPTKNLNQTALPESAELQPAISSIPRMKLQKDKYDNAEHFVTANMGQYLNCALTKQPFVSDKWDGNIIRDVLTAIQKDPNFGVRVSENAFNNALGKGLNTNKDLSNEVVNNKTLDISLSR